MSIFFFPVVVGSSSNIVNWWETIFQQWCPVTSTAGISRTAGRKDRWQFKGQARVTANL